MPPMSALSLSQSLLIPVLYKDDEEKQAQLLSEAARNLAYNIFTEVSDEHLAIYFIADFSYIDTPR